MRAPAPLFVRMMAAKVDAERRLGQLIEADLLIHAHITVGRHQGEDFGTWTPEKDAAFRNRHRRAVNA